MNQLLIVTVAAAATFYALSAAEVPALRRERDGLLRAALKDRRAATVALIAGRLPRTSHFSLQPGEGVILPAGRLRLTSFSEEWGAAAFEYQTGEGE
ncbi:hypothetical protein RDMS_01700 [Deinococcus sp. RL]|uniref:hypothetical protein n=1 Tax=Deinococcus sp. RL TaxID=1489678 RepID=UPI0004D5A1A3|nr:hypothetical protein [Deinococcus sp. RL]KEF35496.1 hypothetical protein RDMS_01700 [Deinococcus sp. RL]